MSDEPGDSGDDDPPEPDGEQEEGAEQRKRPESGGEQEEDVERRKRELEQRERGLNDFANELDAREEELDERERDLRNERKRLDEREAQLDERESRIGKREAELDDREVAIGERERELSERAAELDEKEAAIQEYVNDSVRATVRETVEETIAGGLGESGSTGRFGTIGSLILALVGMMLVVGGVINGVAADLPSVPVVFASDTANLTLSILLLFSGLAANLAAVTD